MSLAVGIRRHVRLTNFSCIDASVRAFMNERKPGPPVATLRFRSWEAAGRTAISIDRGEAVCVCVCVCVAPLFLRGFAVVPFSLYWSRTPPSFMSWHAVARLAVGVPEEEGQSRRTMFRHV